VTSDLRSHLQDSLGSAYTLERELGGGMSRVFLASESRLKRKVVVKVLTPELAAGVSADRFEREIMLAAQLSHPSIVPLLTAGEAGGLPYYTMPFVEGESLRVRLAERGLPSRSDAVGMLRDVARALAYAHEHGVVHRDIKPDNVLLAGEVAVVTDFGIAKAISAARSEAGNPTLTGVGTALGTPAYMAPEQASGDPATDARADIYSFGCLAYEMLAGAPPFGTRSMHQILAAHLAEPPPELLSRCTDCPAGLAALVMQCLKKDPAERPQSAREILQALDAVISRSDASLTGVRAAGSTRAARLVVPALAILLVAAVAFFLIQRRRTNAASGTAGVPRSIVVLPFDNASGDTSDAYFADGMAEELATALSKVRGLRVVARNSAFRSGGREVDPKDVGRTLAVDALLAGTVRRSRDQMRLNVQLTRTSDGSILWSEQYQKQSTDVFALQDEMASAIVGALQVQLSPSVTASSAPNIARGTSNLEALDLYLRGQFNLRRRGAGIRLAAENFRQAIAKDSGFARAYSGLSAALELFPYFAAVSPDSVFNQVMAAARRALTLDSTLAEAHTSMALAYQHSFQWQRAEEEHRRAIALDPNDAAAHMHFARFLTYVGRPDAALTEAQRAKALDPYSAVNAGWVVNTLRFTGKLDAALTEARRAMELDSVNPLALTNAANTLLVAGQLEEAQKLAARINPALPFVWPGIVAHLFAATGDPGVARRLVRDIESMPRRPWGAETTLAFAYLGLRDTSRALAALERALDTREMWPSNLSLYEPMYDLVRQSPRFAALLRRVGLDPSHYTTFAVRPTQ
jgi:eukaryotic-like serine/threonine-protein kinase